MKKWAIKSLVLAASCLSMSSAFSAQPEDFQQYVLQLKQQGREQGISEQTLEVAFANVTFRPHAVKADNNQPERRLTLDEYIPRAVPQWKINQAKALYQQHKEILNEIGYQYGVQPRFIVALWGVESNFGKFMGNYNIIDALSTMAYEGRREDFFRSETMAALTILDQGHIQMQDFKGSWAGAMGQCQFMPSSFLTYAADGDGDGRKDIWQSKADVFASAANYLSQSGWNNEYSWGRQVSVPQGFDMELEGRVEGKQQTLAQWSKLGIKTLDGQELPQPSEQIDAWLTMPDKEDGRAYLVYNNYNVLMKWNHSYYFALAVSSLADAIVDR